MHCAARCQLPPTTTHHSLKRRGDMFGSPSMWRVFGGPTNPDGARTGGEGIALTFLQRSIHPVSPKHINRKRSFHNTALLHTRSR